MKKMVIMMKTLSSMITCGVVVVDDELEEYSEEDDEEDDEEDGEEDDEEDQVCCLWCRGWRGFPHSRRSRLLQQGPTLSSFISSKQFTPTSLSSQWYFAPCMKRFPPPQCYLKSAERCQICRGKISGDHIQV